MSDKSLAMMPWFPRDFIAATRAMRIAERCAYRELLDFQWELGVLPDDEARLARLIGFTQEEFADAWPAIRGKFLKVDGGLCNQRLEEHRETALYQRDKKRLGADIANAKRDAKRIAMRNAEQDAEQDAERSAKHHASVTPPSPSPSPSPSIREEKKGASLQSAPKESNGSRPARPAAGMRIPDDFELTPERRAYAVKEKLDPERTFEKFVDFWRAKSGAHARKLDWNATWRNWCRNETDHKAGNNGTHQQTGKPRPSAVERVDTATAKWAAERGVDPETI